MEIKQDDIIGQILEKKSRFAAYNNAKISSLHSSLGSGELVNFFNYIPFLFTVNQPEFPGYIKEVKVPHGIAGYTVPASLLSQIRITNPSYTPPRVSTDPVITLFALIGSAGTIAFTPDSDLDFWICGKFSEMDKDEMTLLRRKCSLIEQWAMETRRKEIHFFLNDIDEIKQNVFDEDEEYGMSGTALGQMLKEEFYRSSIIINDVTPFWWVVPADASDEVYEEMLSATLKTSHAERFVDLGNISGLNRGDFLISALFQIIKSLGNPFKSIIKLGLLERYIHDDKKNPFVSNQLKKNVHDGKTDSASVDAYCIMFDNVYSYYKQNTDDMTALNIIKTSFYLKVSPRLSAVDKKAGADNNRNVMLNYAKQWGWDDGIIERVDNFENWDIDSTNRMMNNTKKIILRGYKNILNVLGNEINTGAINRETLLAINRKIYSHFNPEEFKIDNTLNFKKYPPEKLLSLDYVRDIKGNESWYFSKRVITGGKATKILIRKSPHLISLIVWISLNGLYQKDYSRLDIEQGFYNLDANYIRDLISELSEQFSIKSLNLQNSYFLRDPFPVMSYIIINPFTKYSKKIDDIIFLYHNSWGETRFETFTNPNALAAISSRIINGVLVSGMDSINALHITSSEPYSGSKEFHALTSSLKSMLRFFTVNKTPVKQRYITMIANRLTVFSNTVKHEGGTSVSFSQYTSEAQMLYSISYNRGIINRNAADEKTPELDYLAKLLAYDSEDSVKIFIEDGKKFSRFFILNERGALIMLRKKIEFRTPYLSSLISFAESVIDNVTSANPESELAKSNSKIRVYRIENESPGKNLITEYDYQNDAMLKLQKEKNFPVSLSLHLLDNGEVGYRFTLPDGGYSEIFSRAEIESVSREIATLMASIEGYIFYPSSVNLDNTEIRMYSLYTSFAFSEKNRFEMLIEKNLGMI